MAAPERVAQARVRAGEAVDLHLHPGLEVAYPTLPDSEARAAETFGGLARFSVAQPGLYRVGMSFAAWVNVSRNGRPAPYVGFGPGPECTPIRRIVSFQLEPGDYVLEISGNETANIRVMASRSS